MSVSFQSWTKEDLYKLEKAIAQGVKRVKYTDKEIEYRDLKEMFAVRDVIRKSLGLGKKMSFCKIISSKGLC